LKIVLKPVDILLAVAFVIALKCRGFVSYLSHLLYP
jgi:hypothetical protein